LPSSHAVGNARRIMLRPVFVASLVFLAAVVPAVADSCRIVLLEIPKGQAAAVAADLAGGRQGDASVMDSLLKKRGLRAIVDKTQTGDCWSAGAEEVVDGRTLRRPHEYVEDLTNTAFGSRRPHESSIRIVADKQPTGIRQIATIKHFLLDGKERAVETLGLEIGSFWLKPGRWQELCRISNAKTEVAVWQFGTADGIASAPADNRVIEMKVFQAEAADVAQLAKAAPASRDNALNWLSGRAKPWREIRYTGLISPRSKCEIVEQRYDDRKNPGPQVGNHLRILVDKPDAQPDAAGPVTFGIGEVWGNPPVVTDFKADMDPGVWNFTPFTGRDFTNLLAWRVIKDDK